MGTKTVKQCRSMCPFFFSHAVLKGNLFPDVSHYLALVAVKTLALVGPA